MSILLGLSPFIGFFVVMRFASPAAALATGFVLSLLLFLRGWRRGDTIKILEVGSLVLFGALTLYTVAAAAVWSVATARLCIDGGLLAIVVVSLAIDRPFTLQYAREQVPQQFWSSPLFINTNRIITAVWAAAFAVMVAADAAAEYLPMIPVWIDVVASVAGFVVAVWFTRWYPATVRRAAQAAAGAP